jgi:cytochrome c553
LVPLAYFCLAPLAAAQGDASLELRSLAATCAACHGTDGHAAPGSGLRSLAPLSPALLTERMRAFREDKALTSSVMAQIARGYDDQQVQRLAGYFAAQR